MVIGGDVLYLLEQSHRRKLRTQNYPPTDISVEIDCAVNNEDCPSTLLVMAYITPEQKRIVVDLEREPVLSFGKVWQVALDG